MSHHIVEVTNLRHVYPDGTEALRGVSFRITHGESVAIIGANGAGKSTLLLHLNGQPIPSEGSIRIGDFPLNKATLPEIRRTVGMVFQNPDDQLFMPTVYDDVAFGPLNLGFPRERVAIATVLSMSPDILVMDEPTSGLDPCARRQLMRLLREFRHTKIFTSHDLDMVLDVCERVIVLHEGEVMADGPTREIFVNDQLLAECRLEKPLSMQGCPVCGTATRP
jgi:cobalt/nickel transport system ATP-binding protein